MQKPAKVYQKALQRENPSGPKHEVTSRIVARRSYGDTRATKKSVSEVRTYAAASEAQSSDEKGSKKECGGRRSPLAPADLYPPEAGFCKCKTKG